MLRRIIRGGVQRALQRVQHSSLPTLYLPQKAGDAQHSRNAPAAGHNGRVRGGAPLLGRNAQHIGPVHGGCVGGQQVICHQNHRAGQARKVLPGQAVQQAQQALGHIVQVCRALGHGFVLHGGHHLRIAPVYTLHGEPRRAPVAQNFRFYLLHNHLIVHQIEVCVKNGRLFRLLFSKALLQAVQLFPGPASRRGIGPLLCLRIFGPGKFLPGMYRLRRIKVNRARCHPG